MVLILTLMVGIIVSMDSEPQYKSTTTSILATKKWKFIFLLSKMSYYLGTAKIVFFWYRT